MTPVLPTISTASIYTDVGSAVRVNNAVCGNVVWPAADRAIFVPFTIEAPITVTRMFTYNSITASGNIDVGIYTLDGTLIVSSGSTAMSGTVTLQAFDITDTLLAPGAYYMAMACSSGTANFKASNTALLGGMAGVVEMAAALPLPATATFASLTSSYVPCFGMSQRSFV